MSTHYDSQFDDWEDEPDFMQSDVFDRDDDDKWGCVFGEKCCMPGDHMTDECHTAEMADEYMREAMEG